MTLRLPALGAAVLALALLAGCGDDADPKAGTPAATTSHPVTPANPQTPASGASQPGGGRVVVEDGLPSGFPAQEIPLIDADVVNGTVGEPGSRYSWTVVLQPQGELKTLADEAAAKLEAAGFRAGGRTDLENLQVRQLSSAKYDVGFTATHSGEGVLATYVVTEKR